MKKQALAAALVLGASLGAAVQEANAYVYGRSYIDIDNLQLGALQADGSPADVTIRSYVNTITNTAALNGTPAGQETATCTLGNPTPCPFPATPVLDALPSQIGAPAKANNDFTFEGPDATGEFARADGVVHTAAVIEIAGGVSPAIASTDVEGIAESQLQFGQTASSQSQLQSTTGLTLAFTVAGDGTFVLNFDANWDVLAEINTASAANSASAQAEIQTTVTLARDDGTRAVTYTPGGLFGDCLPAGGTCVTTGTGDLNQQYAVSTDPASQGDFGSDSLGFAFDGLNAGDWTLVLNTTVRTLLIQDIPVPGTVGLLGLGLTGLGFAGRRRKRVTA